MFKITSISRFCITAALEVELVKSPLGGGLAKLETTGQRDPGQPFTADEVSVNRELHACGFYIDNPALAIIAASLPGEPRSACSPWIFCTFSEGKEHSETSSQLPC